MANGLFTKSDQSRMERSVREGNWEDVAHILGWRLKDEEMDGLEDWLAEGNWEHIPTISGVIKEWRAFLRNGEN
jgi:hypothetical protein